MNINHIIKWNFFCIATFSALIGTGCSGSKGSIHEAATKADLAKLADSAAITIGLSAASRQVNFQS